MAQTSWFLCSNGLGTAFSSSQALALALASQVWAPCQGKPCPSNRCLPLEMIGYNNCKVSKLERVELDGLGYFFPA